jgi:hypothetical protein
VLLLVLLVVPIVIFQNRAEREQGLAKAPAK